MRVFIDTSAFCALTVDKDTHHRRAIDISDGLEEAGLFTSHLVLAETITLVKRRAGQQRAESVGRLIREDRRFTMLMIDERIDELAWQWFIKYSDQPFSYVDCTSFALMAELGIERAFTFDEDFRRAGFEPLQTTR